MVLSINNGEGILRDQGLFNLDFKKLMTFGTLRNLIYNGQNIFQEGEGLIDNNLQGRVNNAPVFLLVRRSEETPFHLISTKK